MVLLRLAFKNARQNFNRYFVYVFACALAITIYFAFNALALTPYLWHTLPDAEMIKNGLLSTNAFILIFIVAFMFYANLFFVQQQRREIALFNLLGVSRWRISGYFFLENLLLGLLSLILGLLLGILLAKLFALLLVKLIGASISVGLLFSGAAIGQTIGTFLLVYIFLALFDAGLIAHYPLAILFRQPVTDKVVPITFWRYLLGLLGLALLASAYGMAQFYTEILPHFKFLGAAAAIIVPLLILVFVLVGTFLFYRFSLLALLMQLRHWYRFSYRKIRLFTLANLSQRLHRHVNISWLVTILAAITLTVLGSITMIYTASYDGLNTDQPLALTVDRQLAPAVAQHLTKHQLTVQQKQPATFKVTGAQFKLDSLLGFHYGAFTGPLTVISQQDYQAARRLQPNLPAFRLNDQQVILLLRKLAYAGQTKRQQVVTLRLTATTVKQLKVKQVSAAFPYGANNYVNDTGLVVSDAVFQRLNANAQTHLMAFQFAGGHHSEQVSQQLIDRYQQHYHYFDPQKTGQPPKNLHTFQLSKVHRTTAAQHNLPMLQARYPTTRWLRTLFGLDFYIIGFFSLIFIMATGSIIMLKQLAEAAEKRQQYALLIKLGISQREINHTIYLQTGIAFLLPITLGVINAYFALHILNIWLNQLDLTFAYLLGAIYLAVYIVYWWLTAKIYCRMITPT